MWRVVRLPSVCWPHGVAWGGRASKQAIFTLLERKEVGIGQNLERIWANEGYSLPGEVTGKGMGVASFDGYDLDREGDMRGWEGQGTGQMQDAETK